VVYGPGAPLGDRGHTIVPQLATGTRPRLIDRRTYRKRNGIVGLLGRLTEPRLRAIRYDKLASSYLTFVHLAAILMLV